MAERNGSSQRSGAAGITLGLHAREADGSHRADGSRRTGDDAPKIAVEGVSHRYGSLAVLQDVILDVREGDFLAMVGPSGCGKSSLLRLLAGLETPTAGRIRVDGKPLAGPHPKRNLVFQDHSLYPWRTVFQNVAFGLEIQRVPAAAVARRVGELIELVGLGGFERYYPHQLSGGMRQRVALARALAVEPDVLLLDEPFGPLDALTRLGLQDELLRLRERVGKTIVLITHDVEEAVYLADRVAVMSPRPGRIKDIVAVREPRPRRRSSAALAALRGRVLAQLGLGDEAEAAGEGKAAGEKLPVPELDPLAVQEILAGRADVQLIDVREPWEFRQSHIPGSVLLPKGQVAQRLGDIARDRPAVIVCRSGRRSGEITRFLLEQGYDEVYNLAGGILAWGNHRLPLAQEPGAAPPAPRSACI